MACRLGVQKVDTVYSDAPPKSPPRRHETREIRRGASPPKHRATVHPGLVLAGRYKVDEEGGAVKWWEDAEYLTMTWHPAEGPIGVINAAREPHPGEVRVVEVREGLQASAAGVQQGMKMVAVNHTEVVSLSASDLVAFVQAQRKDRPCDISFALPAGMKKGQGRNIRWEGMPTQEETQHRRDRRLQLRKVFELFDFDANGAVDKQELMKVGQARRRLGHATGWSAPQNEALFAALDLNQDGAVAKEEFITAFEESLPKAMSQFNMVIDQFLAAAREVRSNTKTLLQRAEERFAKIVAHSGSRGGVTKATLVHCHGGDFGLFERMVNSPPPALMPMYAIDLPYDRLVWRWLVLSLSSCFGVVALYASLPPCRTTTPTERSARRNGWLTSPKTTWRRPTERHGFGVSSRPSGSGPQLN